MKPVDSTDSHLVAHDVTSLGTAGVLGLTATAVTGSPEAGLVTAALISVTGIGSMRIGPVRRTVNRAVVAAAEVSSRRKAPGK